jgi:hypothetical protein
MTPSSVPVEGRLAEHSRARRYGRDPLLVTNVVIVGARVAVAAAPWAGHNPTVSLAAQLPLAPVLARSLVTGLSRHRADLRPCSAVPPPGHRAVHPGQRQPPTVLVGLRVFRECVG